MPPRTPAIGFGIVPQAIIRTLAGSSAGTVDAIGAYAKFNYPEGVALAADGATLYVAEKSGANIAERSTKPTAAWR